MTARLELEDVALLLSESGAGVTRKPCTLELGVPSLGQKTQAGRGGDREPVHALRRRHHILWKGERAVRIAGSGAGGVFDAG
jgi:hypothetical protein